MNIGDRMTYFPPKAVAGDNLHFPCVIEKIGAKRVTVRVFAAEAPPRRPAGGIAATAG